MALVAALVLVLSLGAVWSSCSPDFGTHGIVDRFGQIEPKVLFTADACYSKKNLDTMVISSFHLDPVASIVQPVRRLRGFQRVTRQPGESKPVTFTLGRDDVGFYDSTGKFVVEPGAIDVFVNDRSTGGEQQTFQVTAG